MKLNATAEIEKIANEMIHDDLPLDEEDGIKLNKVYRDQVKEDCNLDDEEAMKISL